MLLVFIWAAGFSLGSAIIQALYTLKLFNMKCSVHFMLNNFKVQRAWMMAEPRPKQVAKIKTNNIAVVLTVYIWYYCTCNTTGWRLFQRSSRERQSICHHTGFAFYCPTEKMHKWKRCLAYFLLTQQWIFIKKNKHIAIFKVLTEVSTKFRIFWDVTPRKRLFTTLQRVRSQKTWFTSNTL